MKLNKEPKRVFMWCAVISAFLTFALLIYIRPIPETAFTVDQDFRLVSGETRDGRQTQCYEPDELNSVFSYQLPTNKQNCSTEITINEIVEEMKKRTRILRHLPILTLGLEKLALKPPLDVEDYEYCVKFIANPVLPSLEKPFITVVLHDGEKISPGGTKCKKVSNDLSGKVRFESFSCTKDYSPFIVHFKKTIRARIDVIIQPEFWIIQTSTIILFTFLGLFALLSIGCSLFNIPLKQHSK